MWALIHQLHDAPHRVALVVLWAFLASGLWTALTRTGIPVVVMVLLAGLWLLTNSSMEGEILLTLSPTHGVTRSDLAAPLVVVIALLVRVVRP